MELAAVNEVNLRDCDTISTSTASNSDIDVEIPQNNQICEQLNAPVLSPPNVATNINSLSLQSSSGAHFGNRVIYNGPVNFANSKSDEGASEGDLCSLRFLLKHRATLISTACSLVLFALLILVLAIKFDNSVDESTVSYPYQLKIIKRSEWNAEAPSAVPELLESPSNVILVDCTGRMDCYSEKVCSETMRDIQREHMAVKGYPDIGFNFIIANNGLVYEGTGWDVQGSYAFVEKLKIADHLEPYNLTPVRYDKVLSIAFNGNDCDKLANLDQKFAAHFLQYEGSRQNKLANDSVVFVNLVEKRRELRSGVEHFLKSNSFRSKAKDVFSIAMNMKNCSSPLTRAQKFAGVFLAREGVRLRKLTNTSVVMDLNAQREKLLRELMSE